MARTTDTHKEAMMTIKLHNKRETVLTVTPHYTGTIIPYRMAYLSEEQKQALGLPRAIEYAIRIDGDHQAELVKVVNGYTSYKMGATIIA